MPEKIVADVKTKFGVSNRTLAALATERLGKPINAGQFSRRLTPELRNFMGRLLQQKALKPEEVSRIRDTRTGEIRSKRRQPSRKEEKPFDQFKRLKIHKKRSTKKKRKKGKKLRRFITRFTCRLPADSVSGTPSPDDPSIRWTTHEMAITYSGKGTPRGIWTSIIRKHDTVFPTHTVVKVHSVVELV